MTQLEYRQVDVFADRPLCGNGLAVIITQAPLIADFMQRLTCELRQFETIFLCPSATTGDFEARVFTMEEELPFAGHPAIGAAAVLHERAGGDAFGCGLSLPAGRIALESCIADGGYRVTMHQGAPSFGAIITDAESPGWLDLLGLSAKDRDPRMPVCVASTGLPYLVVPVTSAGLAKARIAASDLEQKLATVGAKFVYVLDVENREGRTWDNGGSVEDIATGSAAGPVAALLVRHGLASAGETLTLRQGRFVGRPSEMQVQVLEDAPAITDILLSGQVCMVASGRFEESVNS